jgi:hypothetical protein
MKDKKSSDSRRKLLKSIAAGSGAIVAGKSLPESWSRPVVDSVMLPAHAQTSPVDPSAPGGCTGCYPEGNDSSWQYRQDATFPEGWARLWNGTTDCSRSDVDNDIRRTVEADGPLAAFRAYNAAYGDSSCPITEADMIEITAITCARVWACRLDGGVGV